MGTRRAVMPLGAPELGIILVILLVLFGSSKLPSLARSLGQAKREFEAGQEEPLDHDASAQAGER